MFYLFNAFCHCVRPGQLWLHRLFIVITSSAFFSCFVLLVFLDLLFVLLGPCLKLDFFKMFLHPAVFVWPCALWFWPSPAALFIKISIYINLALSVCLWLHFLLFWLYLAQTWCYHQCKLKDMGSIFCSYRCVTVKWVWFSIVSVRRLHVLLWNAQGLLTTKIRNGMEWDPQKRCSICTQFWVKKK